MTLVRSAIRQGGTWHPHHGGATIWMTGKKHVTPDGGVIYPKTLYPKRYYKFGYEKLTNPDDLYDAHVLPGGFDGCDHFQPEYRLFKGQQRRRPTLGYKGSSLAPRFCWKNPEKALTVWHADDSFVYDHITVVQRVKWFFAHGSWAGRTGLWMNLYPLLVVKFANTIERRREPQEIFVDREEYFRNWETFYYGIYYDHHKFQHMLQMRRANKWHYDNKDLQHAH